MTLTKEELSLWMPIFQAFLDGKTIQRHNGVFTKINGEIVLEENGWTDYNFDILDFSASPLNHSEITNPTNCFRVKPTVI